MMGNGIIAQAQGHNTEKRKKKGKEEMEGKPGT